MRRVLPLVLSFIFGTIVAYHSAAYLRSLIQDIYRWSTDGHIVFVGKNFLLFPGIWYYLCFGIATLIVVLDNFNRNVSEVVKNIVISLLLFSVSLVGVSAFDANLKIMECTMCDDGIRSLRWNDVNYDMFLGLSAVIGVVPSIVRGFKSCMHQLNLKANRKLV